MRLYILVIALLVPGCGTADNAATSASDDSSPGAEESRSGRPDGSTQRALLIADASALPACDEASEGLLVYVKADAAFQACGGGEWAVIDINGKDGVDGKDGKDGEAGEAGQDGVAAAANTWRDSVSDITWLIGGTGGSLAPCSGDWRGPTFAEIDTARNHGMYAGFLDVISADSNYECALTSDSTRNAVKPAVNCGATAGPWGIYCIYNPAD